jgi:hypothetical protein
MCCFSPVSAPAGLISWLFRRTRSATVDVAGTRIFARWLDGAEQALIYSMRISVAGDVAMILPLPVVPRSGDDAVRFVDLERYPRLFDDVASGFFDDMIPLQAVARSKSFLAPRPKLVVHSVGSFIASYVPSRGDFDRLDPRFRLPDSVWAAMGRYDDWGFAVFQLKRGKRKQIHPMAFRFESRDPGRLFMPTVHVHDGTFHPTATFDHELYYQHPSLADPATHGRDPLSDGLASTFVRIADTKGLVDGSQRIARRSIHGEHANADTWIDDPARPESDAAVA